MIRLPGLVALLILSANVVAAEPADFSPPDVRLSDKAAASLAEAYLVQQGDAPIDDERALANAMLASVLALRPNFSDENALAALEAVAARFGGAQTPEVARIAARAEISRASLLLRIGRFAESLSSSEAILAKFSPPGPLSALDVRLGASFNQIDALNDLKRFADATVSANALLALIGEPNDPAGRAAFARATLGKALGLGGLRRYQEERELLQGLIARLRAFDDIDTRWRVAFAYYDLGIVEEALNRPDAALTSLNAVVDRYGKDDKASFGYTVFLAHKAKVRLLVATKRLDQANAARRALFDYAIALPDARMRAEGADALFDAAGAREEAKDLAGAIALYDRIAGAFTEDPRELRTWLEAKVRRAIDVADMGQGEVATAEIATLVARADGAGWRDATEVLQALRAKGRILEKLNLAAEADGVYADLLARAGEDLANPIRRDIVMYAMTRRAVFAPDLGHDDLAISLYGDIIRRFGGFPDAESRYAVARALLNRGALLANLRREDECLADFTSVVSLFQRDDNPRMTENLAPARLNAAHVLLNLGRVEEARRGLEEFLRLYPRPTPYVSAQQIENARQLLREAKRR